MGLVGSTQKNLGYIHNYTSVLLHLWTADACLYKASPLDIYLHPWVSVL